MTRLRDWPERFNALVQSHAHTPFDWGAHDCCTFAADAVQAITGQDVMAGLRASYSSALSATNVLARLGGMQCAVSALLGPAIGPVYCSVGDVLLVKNEGRDLLAVCNGASGLAPGPLGLVAVDIQTALAGWRVG